MNLEEKKQKSIDFVVNSLSWETYSLLHIFSINVRYMTRFIELSRIVSHKIESGEIKGPTEAADLMRTKHLVLLDSLARLMMIIEATLALLSAISDSRTPGGKIANRMLRYDQNQIDAFISHLKNRQVDVWRLAGFPKIRTLQRNCGLTKSESKFVWELLSESCDLIRETLDQIVDFYEKNRIIYGKFKHGLTFLLGFELFSQSREANRGLPPTAILVLDRRSRQPGEIGIYATGLPKQLDWFNTVSMLSYSDETFKKHNGILHDVEKLVTHITNNHLLRAENCGEDYFPAEQRNGIWTATLYLRRDLSQGEQDTFEAVMRKIFSNAYTVNRSVVFNFNLNGQALEKLYEGILKDSVATIFSNRDQKKGRACLARRFVRWISKMLASRII